MSQEVILVSDVPGLGQLGELRKVKEGYARNYLIPKQLAVFATADQVKKFERQKEKVAADRDKRLSTSKSLADKISKVGLVFERPVGPGGRLFGSVTPFDIVAEMAKQGITVEKKSVLMSGALKTLGEQKIRVRIHSQVVVDVPVKIVGKETNVNQHKVDAQGADAPVEEQAIEEHSGFGKKGRKLSGGDRD